MLAWFQAMMPKQGRFFDQFEAHAATLVAGAAALERLFSGQGTIAEHVADRLGCAPTDLLPTTVGHVSLALALAAYDAWMVDPSRSLAGLVDEAMRGLRTHLGC